MSSKKPVSPSWLMQVWNSASGGGNSIASNDNTADKALGICWELPSDKLHLPSSSVDLPTQWTRRSLLRIVAALFDPLGLMSPVTITGRILLQFSWKEKQDWDAPLSSELCRRTEKWKQDIAQIDSFSACRWIGTHPEGVYNLHLFSDASEVAYGCCVYLVMEEEKKNPLTVLESQGSTSEINITCKA